MTLIPWAEMHHENGAWKMPPLVDNRPIPRDLCPAHLDLWKNWRDYHYDWHKPTEWGGGHIMDDRTPYEERIWDWLEKNRWQTDFIERACRSGHSDQCGGEPETSAPPAVITVHAPILTGATS